ncbi:MAG TPA: NAD(P)H-dependent oxidoreductase subunit E [Chitinispirillaceae bacterium]|nr:NAD(P)H-dependent oxidoreductase subunit E [Chitinispirillaceae bacterium]
MENNAAICTADGAAKEMFDKLDQFIDSLGTDSNSPRRKGDLIRILHQAQHIFGYLPEEVQIHVARKLKIHHSEVSGVISFYNYFTTEPRGKHNISICLGTACFVKGADKILEEFEKELGIKAGQVTEDMEFSIDVVRCIGACGLAPVITIGEKVFGKLTPGGEVKKILSQYKSEVK